MACETWSKGAWLVKLIGLLKLSKLTIGLLNTDKWLQGSPQRSDIEEQNARVLSIYYVTNDVNLPRADKKFQKVVACCRDPRPLLRDPVVKDGVGYIFLISSRQLT